MWVEVLRKETAQKGAEKETDLQKDSQNVEQIQVNSVSCITCTNRKA